MKVTALCICLFAMMSITYGQVDSSTADTLNKKDKNLIIISSLTASGNLNALEKALNKGLDEGLTVNEIKELLVHTYAYCGFPRNIRGLQTFMLVLDERKLLGVTDTLGKESSPIVDDRSKYERGKKKLEHLTRKPQPAKPTGYGAFAPTMDIFLKEHLFADIFERDALSAKQRELATISVIASIGQAEPMLKSHLLICLNLGFTAEQLEEFVILLNTTVGNDAQESAKKVLDEVLNMNK